MLMSPFLWVHFDLGAWTKSFAKFLKKKIGEPIKVLEEKKGMHHN
jgi:hypothetical protein